MPITVEQIKAKKKAGEKIAMLTAYDYPLAHFIDEAGADIILVGDSVANVVLGLETTNEVSMEAMLHHAKAVRRAVRHALLVGDMPFEAYQKDVAHAVLNAKRFIKEAGCCAVKLEWFDQCLQVTEEIVSAGIPVMGHLGLTPQTAEKLGGFKVQGKEAQRAEEIIRDAIALEKKGCFCIVLECVPSAIAEIITKKLSIPTIGIGAGVYCDGQVLVTHDLLGLFDRFRPKFVKQYVNLSATIQDALGQYIKEVRAGQFPDEEHTYHMKKEEIDKIKI